MRLEGGDHSNLRLGAHVAKGAEGGEGGIKDRKMCGRDVLEPLERVVDV